MATPRYLSDLAGTLWASFRVGLNRLVSASGVITARNAADSANVDIAAAAARLVNADGKKTTLSSATGLAADVAFKLPAADGATNQAMATDGSGNLSFITVATGANAVKSEDQLIAFGSTSPVAIVVLPAGATIQKVTVEVETAFDGTPSLSVGVAGTPSKYMGATDMDLSTVAIFQVEPMIEEVGSVTPIVTYAAGSASVGSARVTVQWVLPG
jgi:hypothetical protein